MSPIGNTTQLPNYLSFVDLKEGIKNINFDINNYNALISFNENIIKKIKSELDTFDQADDSFIDKEEYRKDSLAEIRELEQANLEMQNSIISLKQKIDDLKTQMNESSQSE